MRRITFWIFGSLGVLLAIALIIPFFVNVNDYKPLIITKTKEALGRDVHIDGELSLSLLPSPYVTIRQVRVGNIPQGSSKDFLKIKNLHLSVAFLPLLKKTIKLTSVEVDQPEVFLEKLDNGQVNWSFPPSSQESSSNFEVAVDKVTINDGRLLYHAGKQTTEIQHIQTKATLGPNFFPSSLTATLKAFDQEIKLEGNLAGSRDVKDLVLHAQAGLTNSMLKGQFSLKTLDFKGHLDADIDPKGMADKSPLFSKPWKVHTNITATQDAITLTSTQFEIGSARPQGNIDIAFRNGFSLKAVLKDLPGQGACQVTFAPSPQGLAGQIDTAIPRVKELITWLGVEASSLPKDFHDSLSLSTQYVVGDQIVLKNLSLLVGVAKLQGGISGKLQNGSFAVAVDLNTSKVENLIRLLSTSSAALSGPGHLQGKILGDTSKLTLDTSLHLGDLSLKTQGTATKWLSAPELDFHINLHHAHYKASVETRLQGKPDLFHLTNLKGSLGREIQFSGKATVNSTGAKPNIQAGLEVNSLNLDTLLAAHEPQPQIYLISAKKRSTRHSSSNAPSHASSHTPWSHDPVDLSFLRKFDGQFDIKSGKLTQKDLHIAHPKLVAKIQNGQLELTSLSGSVFGGELKAHGHLTADNALQIHVNLNEANLKNLWTQEGKIKITHGKLSLATQLKTHGKSVYDMVSHLAGPLTLQAHDGVISGFDLHAISQRLGNLKDIGSLLSLMNANMASGQTPFSSFKGDMTIQNGIAKINSMTLIAKGGEGHATGSINLPAYTLDVRCDMRFTEHPKIPPFQMHLSGPIDHPQRHLDASNLQKYMMDNVFKGVIEQLGKGKLGGGKILDSLLGGGGDKAPSNANEPSSSSPKPDKIVKDIFKGLF